MPQRDAAPLGLLEAGADTSAGAIDSIENGNSANSLSRQGKGADQAWTRTAIRGRPAPGPAAIGFTIYPWFAPP